MKKTQVNKFPHSAALFLFCKDILKEKHRQQILSGKNPKKIIDQDVGMLLQFDPADCSHWKKGKKEVKSLFLLTEIAKRFQMEEEIVISIATGEKNPKDGVFDYKGYDDLKKTSLSKEHQQDMHHMVLAVLEKGRSSEIPVKMQEIMIFFPEAPSVLELSEEDVPYLQYLQAIKLFMFLWEEKNILAESFWSLSQEQALLYSHVFAAYLLIPETYLMRSKDFLNDFTGDIISDLSKIFQVSKVLMGWRIKSFFL